MANMEKSEILNFPALLEKLDIGGDASDLLAENFDVKEHANKALQSGVTISDQLAKLSEGILLLNTELHKQVVAHHDNLLSQATGVETLEGVLQMMQNRIQALMGTTERIRNRVSEPFSKISVRMAQLTRLQETCDMLRKIIRILYLTKRLKVQLQGGAREITKAAQSLNELDYISEGIDFSGIEVLEKDKRVISQARIQIESQAQSTLTAGITNLNQNQVGTALQVFYNLGSLNQVLDSVMQDSLSQMSEFIQTCLENHSLNNTGEVKQAGPGRVNMPVNSAAFRANLWTALENIFGRAETSLLQVHHLQKVLLKKRDTVSQVSFICEYSKHSDPNITTNHWRNLTELLNNKLAERASRSNPIKQALEGEYPKLLKLGLELSSRVNQAVRSQNIELPTLTAEDSVNVDMKSFRPDESLRSALTTFETAYLSRSLSRLFDPINLIFQQGSSSPPSSEEVETLIKTLISELAVASFDKTLSESIAKNITKTLQLFAVKCEQMLVTDGEASQVIGPATAGQRRNAAVVNCLHQLNHSTRGELHSLMNIPNANQSVIGVTEPGLNELTRLMRIAVEPLLLSIVDSLEAIILTMHQEDFSVTGGPSSEAQCSLYMRELQGFLARSNTDYLGLYECTEFILESLQPHVCKGIELFVRQASLIRPLGEGGKMRLAADFAQMESAVHPLCKRVSDLGKSYKLLRAFRPLLFQSVETLVENPAVGDIIPHSTVLHFLFTKAPPELKSPHQVSDWSLSRYTSWLDSHPAEKDKLTLIKGTLEAYVRSVSSRQGTEFASIYPFMLKMLQTGLKS